jgi:hypothetical protein
MTQGWLEQQMAEAKKQVDQWSDWKRDTLRDQMSSPAQDQEAVSSQKETQKKVSY